MKIYIILFMILSTLVLLITFNWYKESKNIIVRDSAIAIYSITIIYCFYKLFSNR